MPAPFARLSAQSMSCWPALILLAAGAAVYANSLDGPLVFDGVPRIVHNPAIRQVWPPWGWLGYDRRPVAYFTFAVNFALGGLNVRGYHITNVAIHLAAGLVLWGILRRTLARWNLQHRGERPAGISQGFGTSRQLPAGGIALAAALLWLVHPLQTQSVTYVVQRIESLMGLFFLLTLYAFLRAQESLRPRLWYAVSVACCTLGCTTKEVAAMAPLVVIWYDRVFVAGSWGEVFARRRWYYAALALPWILLGYLMASRWRTYGGRAGIVKGLTPLDYALTQPGVIMHYLKLSFWPGGQCLDYRWPVARSWTQIVPPAAALAAIVGGTAWAVFRQPAWGFLGGWFLLILAPTSSIVPIDDVAFEHRMYLPLAAVSAAFVLAGQQLARRFGFEPWFWQGVVPAAVVALSGATVARNQVYATGVAVWSDVVAKAPHNARGYVNLGVQLWEADRFDEALDSFRKAVELDPKYALAHVNWGMLLDRLGRSDEALEQFQLALKLDPKSTLALSQMALLLRKRGQTAEALAHYDRLLRVDPHYVPGFVGWGAALQEQGDLDGAAENFLKALEIDPGYPPALFNLGNVRRDQGRLEEALAWYRRALEIDNAYPKAHYNLGNLLRDLGRDEEAVAHYQATLRIMPRHAGAHNNWGEVLHRHGRFAEAIVHFREALRLDPENEAARKSLLAALVNEATLSARAGQFSHAIARAGEALQVDPEFPQAHLQLARTLSAAGRWRDAAAQYARAVGYYPRSAEVRNEFGVALLHAGDSSAAAEQFRIALELDPDFAPARINLQRTAG